MKLEIIKNPSKAEYYGSMFGQDVEPRGTYVLEKPKGVEVMSGWLSGYANIKKPLIIEVNEDNLVDWKYKLSNEYSAKGKLLSNKLMAKGYDAIITRFKNGDTGEIILLPNCSFTLN